MSTEDSKKRGFSWMMLVVTAVVVFGLGLLASSVMERRTEATFVNVVTDNINDMEVRNDKFRSNYPREYDSWKDTEDTSFRSKYNGNAMIDMLEVDPRLVVLWAGYGFSKEYNQGRGHRYAITDMRNILRTGGPVGDRKSPMPATCWTCKSPDVPRLMNDLIEEKGDFTEGVAAFYSGTWETKGHEIVNSIGCADCHDTKTMDLKITRPALIEAFNRQGKDITDASHQEMRSLVCAQCHVEYYFDKKKVEGSPYLTFPWDKGMTVDAAEEYYDEIEFKDWTHKLSKAPMLKAQHPGYEMYLTGIHAERGVSCADCHMPYKSEGGQKFTDHHLQSPLNNIANSCQVCHREEASQLVKDVYDRQDRVIEIRDELEKLLVHAHVEAKTCWDKGATDEQMKLILTDIRHAQWRWDYVAASHGGSFHAPLESARIVGTGIQKAQEARIKLARLLIALGYEGEVPYPNIATKAEAQAYIGLNMDKLNAEKKEFKEKTLPIWVEKAAKREAQY